MDISVAVHVHSYVEWNIFFNSFIDTNVTITCIFFVFRRAQSLLFTLIIILTRSLFIFIRTRSCYVDSFQFLIFCCFVDLSNFWLTCPIVSLTCPIVFLTPNLKKLSRSQTCLLLFISLVIFLIRKKYDSVGSL